MCFLLDSRLPSGRFYADFQGLHMLDFDTYFPYSVDVHESGDKQESLQREP